MLRPSRTILFAGALCVLAALGAPAAASEPNDAIARVNAIIASPAAPPVAPDPCAGRGWSLEHPLRFCGHIRIVPADRTERELWWGERAAEFADALMSARGQRALFERRQVVAGGLRGQAWTIAGVQGIISPAGAEANPFMRPFAAGGIASYLLGFASMDIGQSLLSHAPAGFHIRGLDEVSRRALASEDIGAHLDGARSWVPVLREAQRVSAIASSCTTLAQRSLEELLSRPQAPVPKACASIWPQRLP